MHVREFLTTSLGMLQKINIKKTMTPYQAAINGSIRHRDKIFSIIR